MMEGYKDTPIGMIPEDWDVEKLGDVANLNMGQSPSSDSYNDKGDGLFLVQGNADIKNRKTSPRIWTSQITKECAIGDIIMTVRAPVGAVARSFHRACIGRGVCAINSKSIDLNFLYYVLINYESEWSSLEQGSTFTAVNGKDILGLTIPFPKPKEQSKIASILSTVDDKIDAINERIAQTQQLKNGLMQRLLTKGIGHTKFKDSPLGEIPESWDVVGLDRHIELLSGFPFKSEKFYDYETGTKLLRGVNITSGRLRWSGQIDRWWDEEFDEYEKYSLKEGDLVISMDGSLVGRNYARVSKQFLPLLLVQRVACIRAKETLDLEFLHQIIKSPLFVNYVDAVKTSSGIPHISSKQIKELKIPLPPLPEQNRISNVLSSIDEKLDILQEKKSEYEKLKKGLMQQLLTGKIRVRFN